MFFISSTWVSLFTSLFFQPFESEAARAKSAHDLAKVRQPCLGAASGHCGPQVSAEEHEVNDKNGVLCFFQENALGLQGHLQKQAPHADESFGIIPLIAQ